MSIHNVTPETFDHVCACGHSRAGLAHESIERVEVGGNTVLVIGCPAGHRECLNGALPVEEETSPTRDEASREQVRNVRALHRALGLPGQ